MDIATLEQKIDGLNVLIVYLQDRLERAVGEANIANLYERYDAARRERNYLSQELSRLRIGRSY